MTPTSSKRSTINEPTTSRNLYKDRDSAFVHNKEISILCIYGVSPYTENTCNARSKVAHKSNAKSSQFWTRFDLFVGKYFLQWNSYDQRERLSNYKISADGGQ